MVDERRVRELELRMDAVVDRLDGLEALRGARCAPELPAVEPSTAPRRTAPGPRGLDDLLGGRSLEDLLGGRVLAWVGGLAVLIGVALLFAVGVSSGWIGEGARTLLAGAGSAALLALGVWLHERRGRTDAALAAVATGIAGLFVTITVGAQVYDLLPAPLALGLVLFVGGLATSLAVRWESQGIAALGIVGALVSPVLAGAPWDGTTMAILLVAAASAVGVLLRQRWDWLAFGVFLITVPQWGAYLAEGPPAHAVIAVLTGFGLLGAGAAVGYELRMRSEAIRPSSVFLLSFNAIALAAGGWIALSEGDQVTVANLWLAALAVVHLAIGLWTTRSGRTSHAFGLLALVIGAVLADAAFVAFVDGPLRALGWAGTGVMFALLIRRTGSDRPDDDALRVLGVGVHVALALTASLMSDASPAALLGGGTLELAGAISLAGVAAACLVSARLAEAGHRELRTCLDALGLAVVAYLTALTLDGALLTLAWSVEAVALARLASRTRDEVAGWGALAYLGTALGHVLIFEAPPTALVAGVADPAAAAVSLGSLVAAGVACARPGGARALPRERLLAAAALSCLYLASVLVVTPFQPGSPGAETSLLALDVRQQGQVLLSVLWSLAGFGALVLGLRRDLRLVRLGALALLLVTVGKVFLFDLATLTSVYRVASFIGLGLFLLTAAFAWQRMRPRPLPDLRDVPAGVR